MQLASASSAAIEDPAVHQRSEVGSVFWTPEQRFAAWRDLRAGCCWASSGWREALRNRLMVSGRQQQATAVTGGGIHCPIG
jgi:hypothetical protein